MPDLMTTREAAQALGVHVATIHRMITDGRLRPHQTFTTGGGRVTGYTFRRSDITRIARARNAA